MNIIDLHCDTVLFCYKNKKTLRTWEGHINLEKLREGGCLAQCFALFIPTHDAAVNYLGQETEPWALYQNLLHCYRALLADSADVLRPALSAAQVWENARSGFLSSILTIEDGGGAGREARPPGHGLRRRRAHDRADLEL